MNIFNKIKVNKPNTNYFDLSHDNKLSFNMGELVPICVLDTLPGDSFKINTEAFIRFAPLISPVMHRIHVSMHYFFVPNRLVWSNWEKFITDNNGSEPVPAHPTFSSSPTGGSAGRTGIGSLWNYLGLPVIEAGAYRPQVSAIPFAAYQCIYNEYYRDQNLQPEIDYQLVDGTGNSFNDRFTPLRVRSWRHDYFTAALPWAQKGVAVQIPLSGSMPVKRNSGSGGTSFEWNSDPSGYGANVLNEETTNPNVDDDQLWADGSEAEAVSINNLRTSMKVQEWLEKMARGGSRYIEQIANMFGVRSSDARIQRPEYIGGSKQPVIISEVLQTSESSETPQATMAGHGLSAGQGKRFSYYCEEHGYIIGIASILPDTAYQQGIPRHFSRRDNLDYAWPTLAHLGEQEIKNKELYIAGDDTDEGTFGYIPRYSEYRYHPSRVAGDFRDNLAHWHLGRIFDSQPKLNSDFIKATSGVSGGIRNDIFAVEDPSSQKMWCHFFNQIASRRKLPKYGTPKF